MIQHLSPPAPRDLLPPLLACLPTAFASSKPPPALLPLLSPILRQRVQLLSSNSWLTLLCWDAQVASKLPGIVEEIQLEPHPVSGEVELRDPEAILYRRLDPETLHARLVLEEFKLLPTYLWCTGDDKGWRLAELRGTEDGEDGARWFESIAEANEDAGPSFTRKAPQANGTTNGNQTAPASAQAQSNDAEDDDDDYWASYDRTPGGVTPAQKRSPAPPPASSRVQLPSQSELAELEYFARYAAEVQPALDAHDPDEEGLIAGESTLKGGELSGAGKLPPREPEKEPLETTNLGPGGYDSSFPPPYTANGIAVEHAGHENPSDEGSALNHPRPASAGSSSSVERLEREAEASSQAEMAIKQHISTDMKSLFRLARAAGIEREEFERIIKRELEVLPLLERDE